MSALSSSGAGSTSAPADGSHFLIAGPCEHRPGIRIYLGLKRCPVHFALTFSIQRSMNCQHHDLSVINCTVNDRLRTDVPRYLNTQHLALVRRTGIQVSEVDQTQGRCHVQIFVIGIGMIPYT